MSYRNGLSLILVIYLALIFFSSTSTAETSVVTTTLPNGMQVHVRTNDKSSLTRVGMFFAAGRGNDPAGRAGLAHLAEHLLTESSPAHPDGGLIRQSTLYSTYRNAYTSSGFVQFDTQCLPEFLPQILALEVERLRGSRPDEASFAREKAVVLEEMAHRRRSTSWSQHYEDLYQACYPSHPFGEPVIGTSASVNSITLADYEAFQNRNIIPRRAALVISGPGDGDEIINMVGDLFTMGPNADPEFMSTPPYPDVKPTQVIGDSADFIGVKVSVACRIPLTDRFTASLAAILPNLLHSNRFHAAKHSVPGESIINLGVYFWYRRPPTDLQQHYGRVYSDFDPSQDAQHYLEHIWNSLAKEMKTLADPAVFTKNFDRALAYAADNGAGHGAAMVNGNWALTPTTIRTELVDLTYDQLVEFVAQYITPARATVAITHGRDSERQLAIELAERVRYSTEADGRDALATLAADQIEPVLAAYSRANLSLVQQTTLSNGIPLLYLELPDLSNIRLGGHRVLSPLKAQRKGDKPGIALLYNWVTEYDDRQRRDPEDPYYQPKPLPYRLSFYIEPGQLHYSVFGPNAKIERMAYHLERRLESEKFNQEKWARTIRSGATNLDEIGKKPQRRARGWRQEQILGPDYFDLGYSQPNAESMNKIRYKDLVKVHKKVAGATGQTVLYAAGNLPISTVVAALEPTLGQRDDFEMFDNTPEIKAEMTGIAGQIMTDPSRGDVALIISFPLAPQPFQPDLVTELLLRTLTSQAMTARLREKEGLTYSVFATNQPMSGLMLREIRVTCQPGQAHLVLAAIRQELERITTTGFSKDETARARLSLTGYLIRSCADQDDGFDLLSSLAAFGPLPDDLLAQIASLDTDRINDMSRQVFDADRFAFTAVGPIFEEDIEMFDMD